MARPGDRGASERAVLAGMARKAADLGSTELPEEMAQRTRKQAEVQLGMRCAGCEERIGVGLKFTRIDVVLHEGRPTVDVAHLSACNGADGCDFAEKARAAADAVEMIEFVWASGEAPVGRGSLDEDVEAAEDAVRRRGGDAPASES